MLRHHPGDTSWRLSNHLTKRWRAPRRFTRSRQTKLPPWSGRAGAPGGSQYRPTLPPRRRLHGVLPSFKKTGRNKGITPKALRQQNNKHYLPDYPNSILVFIPSIYHFIVNFSYSLPANIITIFPRKALLWQSTAERKKEWKKERKKKYCCTIPFISFAQFRLHLNRLNYLNKIIYLKLIFSKCFKLTNNHFMKSLKLGFHWNIVLRHDIYSTVPNYPEKTQLNATDLQSNNWQRTLLIHNHLGKFLIRWQSYSSNSTETPLISEKKPTIKQRRVLM